MTVTAWRIVKRKFVREAFAGEGARRYGGRWNSPGTRIVYTSANPGLAALEVLVHLEDERQLRQHYLVVPVTIPEACVEEVAPDMLPRRWASDPPPATLRHIGDKWVSEGRSVALKVPSAVVPLDFNYLLNPLHRDFAKLQIGTPQKFRFDPRLGSKG